MPPLRSTDRSRLRRKADRGRFDAATVEAILDEALLCHVGFVADEAPVVVPMTFVRIDDGLYLHGATGNAMLRAVADGRDVCVTVTLLDALVLARSAFHHSMNYRSAVLFGRAEAVVDEEEKRRALMATVDRMAEGRSGACRPPTPAELRATLVVRIPIDEGSAKVREGGPIDDEADLALPHWAGIIPVALTRGDPVAESDLRP